MGIAGAWPDFELCWWADLRRFRDAASVIAFLRPCKADPGAMHRLRRVLCEHRHLGSSVSRLTDDEVLEAIARSVAAGQMWIWLRPPQLSYGAGPTAEEAPPPAQSEPPRQQRKAPPAPEQQQPTLGNVDPAVMAAAQREAARNGIPFCEECLRQAAAGGN